MKVSPQEALKWLSEQPADIISPEKPQSLLPENLQETQFQTVLEGAILAASVGALLEEVRSENKLSLRETARRVGMKHSQLLQVQNNPNGTMELRSLARIAKGLGYKLHLAFVPKSKKEKRKTIETQIGS